MLIQGFAHGALLCRVHIVQALIYVQALVFDWLNLPARKGLIAKMQP